MEGHADGDGRPSGEIALTIFGLLCLAGLILLTVYPRPLVLLYRLFPFSIVLMLMGGVVMLVFAVFGIGSAIRLARGRRTNNAPDLGWGGWLGQAGAADEDDLCGLGSSGDGIDFDTADDGG